MYQEHKIQKSQKQKLFLENTAIKKNYKTVWVRNVVWNEIESFKLLQNGMDIQ